MAMMGVFISNTFTGTNKKRKGFDFIDLFFAENTSLTK